MTKANIDRFKMNGKLKKLVINDQCHETKDCHRDAIGRSMGRHDGYSMCYFFDVMQFVCVIYERIAGSEAMKRESFAQGFASSTNRYKLGS